MSHNDIQEGQESPAHEDAIRFREKHQQNAEPSLPNDPVPIILSELNDFRSNIPNACESLSTILKRAYDTNYMEFPTIGKEVPYEDLQAKYTFNAYLKERIIGEMYLPHFEFDDVENQFWDRDWAQGIYSCAKDNERLQAIVDGMRETYGANMCAVYVLTEIQFIYKGFAKEIVHLLLTEEFDKKSSYNPSIDDPCSQFIFSGQIGVKQKPCSLVDPRYISAFVHIELGPLQKIDGIVIALMDVSVQNRRKHIEAREAIQLAKELEEQKKHTDEKPYTEKVQKYKDIYEASQRYDEAVLYKLFLEMDLDGDLLLSKDDLWGFCQKKNILIDRKDTDPLIGLANKYHLGKQPYKLKWTKDDPIDYKAFYAAINYQLRIRTNYQVEEVYRESYEKWHYILDWAGIKKDPAKPKLEFKEPLPDYLRKHDANEILNKMKRDKLEGTKDNVIIKIGKSGLEMPKLDSKDGSDPAGQKSHTSSQRFKLNRDNQSKPDLHRPQMYPEKKPEANVVVNDTFSLYERVNRNPWKLYDPDAIDKKVNQQLEVGANNLTTISFQAKEFYDEGYRLSMKPAEILQANMHPIHKYVPVRDRRSIYDEEEPKDQKSKENDTITNLQKTTDRFNRTASKVRLN
jgi:hypothetical protein